MRNILDKTIEYFNPRRALRREAARAAITHIRNFDGAAKGSRYNGWKRGGGSANAMLAGSRQAIVNATRDLARNNPYAVGAIRAAVNNTVGFGINAAITFTGEGQKRNEKAVQAIWWSWSTTTDCDYDGKHNLAGLQRMAFKTERESGEVLVRRIRRKAADGTVPFQLQVLECDYLDDTKDGDLPSGGRIIQGVQYDARGRRTGFWIFETHPGDTGTMRGFYKSNFVPASDCIHMFMEERPGQARGYPCGAPVVTRLRELDEWEDAQLTRQKVASCFSVFIHDSEPLSRGGLGLEHIGVQEAQDGGDPLEYVSPGLITRLPPGKDVKFGAPPGVQDDGFSRSIKLAVAAGYGVTYEAMVGDYSNVNYSSGRMGWIEFGRNIDAWRHLMIIPQMLMPVFHWFEESLILRGYNTETLEVKWTPPKRTMFDPTKEVPAAMKEVRAGFKSLTEVITEGGGDPEVVFAQWKKDAEKLDALGLIFDTDPRNVSSSGQAQQPGNDGSTNDNNPPPDLGVE